jgi:SAM-dependent methyltransferase
MSLARLSMCADWIDREYGNYTLLDVGCRTMDLKPLLQRYVSYSGTDFVAGPEVFECDLEKPLPFEDNAFDIVTALDVLEHLNDPHSALRELFRVARSAVFISLPNMYYISFRKNFLLGRGISGKYVFSPDPVKDRHRWVLSYGEAVRFVRCNAADMEVESRIVLPARGRTKVISEPVEKWLALRWPNLFAYGALIHVKLG